MILVNRPHRGKKRIPFPGQKLHVSVKQPPHGIDDLDDEGEKKPESVREPCVVCDKGEKRDVHRLSSLFLMEIFSVNGDPRYFEQP